MQYILLLGGDTQEVSIYDLSQVPKHRVVDGLPASIDLAALSSYKFELVNISMPITLHAIHVNKSVLTVEIPCQLSNSKSAYER